MSATTNEGAQGKNGERKNQLTETYLRTYPHLVSFCSTCYPFNEATFSQAVLMTYGWMPTSFKLKASLEESIIATNSLLEIKTADINLLESARKTINNSVVGLSKLLHFCQPDVWPIWDSVIASRVNCGSESSDSMKYAYQYNNSRAYSRYFQHVHDLIKSEQIDVHRNYAQQKIPYSVSDVRAIEFYLFDENTEKKAVIEL